MENAEKNKELTVVERAAVALKSDSHRQALALIVSESSHVLQVIDRAGRDQAHRMGMNLRNCRTAIEKAGKLAREDATAFSKAVIAEEKLLIAMVEPEESRVIGMRDDYDKKIAAERQERIDAEAERRKKIERCIDEIRNFETDAARLITAEDIWRKYKELESTDITQSAYQERYAEALALKKKVLESILATHDARAKLEHQEIQAALALKKEQERIALANAELEAAKAAHEAKMAEERAELARQAEVQQAAIEAARIEQAERDRVAAEERDKAAELARQAQAEAQAALDAKQAELQRQLDALAEANAQAEAEARRLQAEKDAQAAAEAKEIADELDRVEAEERAKAEAIAAAESREFANNLVNSWVDSGDATREKPESVNLQLIREIADVLSMDVIAAIDTLRNYPYDDVLAELAAQEVEK